MDILSERLRMAREHAGLSTTQASDLTGINYKTLNNYEHGVSKPDVGKLSKICKAYHISADYFVQPEIDLLEAKSKIKAKEEYSQHEITVLEAYRNQPSMQPAVDRLLGIDREDDRILQQSKEVMELSSMLDEEEIAKSKDPV